MLHHVDLHWISELCNTQVPGWCLSNPPHPIAPHFQLDVSQKVHHEITTYTREITSSWVGSREEKNGYTNPTIFETHHLNSSSFEGPWTLPVKAGIMLGSTGQTLHRHWWTRCLRLIWNKMNKHTPLGMMTNTEIGSFHNKDNKKPAVKWQVTCDDGRFQTLFLKFCKEQQSTLPLGRFLTCTQDSIVCDNVQLAMLWL